MHRDMVRQRPEDPHVDGRQGAQAEQAHALGQDVGPGPALPHRLLQLDQQLRPVGMAAVGAEGAPQHCLPVPVGPLLPAQNQVGAEHQVLVEQVRDAPTELKELQPRAVVREIAIQGREGRLPEQARQQLVHAPQQGALLEPGGVRRIRQPGIQHPPQEARRQGKVHARADPVALRHLLGDPAGHTLVLDNDRLPREGIGKW